MTHTLLTVQVDTVDTLDNVMVAGKWGVCSVNCPGAVSSAGSGSGSGAGSGSGSGAGSGNCETEGGPDPGRPCIFPAIFNGVSYTECGMDPPMCATEVQFYIKGRMMKIYLTP